MSFDANAFLANIKRQVEQQKNKICSSEYQFAKAQAMTAATSGMTTEEKTEYKKKQMEAFGQLQTTVQSNDVAGLEALIATKCLHAIDYQMAWTLCADVPKCAAVASLLAHQF